MLLMLNRSLLILLLFAAGVFGAPTEARMVGVLYSNHSGASGAGTGEIRLRTERGIEDIWYQKPIQSQFASSICYEIGAIWEVVVRVNSTGNTLKMAKCDGRVDRPIHAAWLVVKQYLECRSADQRDTCVDFFSSRWRRSPAYKSVLPELVGIDLMDYRMSGTRGLCLAVREVKGTRIGIDATACSLRRQGKPIEVVFWITRIPGTPHAIIDDVELWRAGESWR